jgi:hypothetical protein
MRRHSPRRYAQKRTDAPSRSPYKGNTYLDKENNMIKKLLLAAIVAGSFGTVALPAAAAVIVVQTAPPALRDEVVPEPRHGYVWVPGYWDWRNNHHVWVAGTWVRERRGYVYHQPEWRERDGHWEMVRGNWARGDRDRDGVPNRMDRHPDNPNRD